MRRRRTWENKVCRCLLFYSRKLGSLFSPNNQERTGFIGKSNNGYVTWLKEPVTYKSQPKLFAFNSRLPKNDLFSGRERLSWSHESPGGLGDPSFPLSGSGGDFSSLEETTRGFNLASGDPMLTDTFDASGNSWGVDLDD